MSFELQRLPSHTTLLLSLLIILLGSSRSHAETGTKDHIASQEEATESAPTPPTERGFISRQLDQLIGTKESAHESGFIMFPTLSYAPETRWDFGLNALYIYFANDRITNRLSELNVYTYYTQNHQYGLWADHTIYSDRNEWFFYGKSRFQYFPMHYYGIGFDSSPDVRAIIDSDMILVRERILKKITGSFYWGLELDFKSIRNMVYRAQAQEVDHELPFGIEGGSQLGLGFGLVYDNCHNAMNVRDGVLAELGFLSYTDALSDYPMTTALFDSRFFYPTTSTQVLALQLQGEFAFGEVPFTQLPVLGGASMMRGYYIGRYRDKRALAAQLEYRFLPFVPGSRWGGAVFASLGTVSPDWTLKRLLWTVGAGPRVLLFPQKDIFTRFDVAFTEEGSGMYLYVGEAF